MTFLSPLALVPTRRDSQAQFMSNPHVVPATSMDIHLPHPPHRAWPQPLPDFIPRRVSAPDWTPPPSVHVAFRLTKKGARKDLRSAGPYAEILVKEFEDEILRWLDGPIVVIDPDQQILAERRQIGDYGSTAEIGRSHMQLIWATPNAFVRYIVHAVSRYHHLVSYSKDSDSGERLTYIHRPTAPLTQLGILPLNTPSITDADSGSEVVVSDVDMQSVSGLSALGEEDEDEGYVDLGDNGRIIHEEREEAKQTTELASSVTSNPSEAEVLVDSPTLDEPNIRSARMKTIVGRNVAKRNTSLRSGSSPSRSPGGRHRPLRGIRGHPLRVVPASTGAKIDKLAVPSTFWSYVYE